MAASKTRTTDRTKDYDEILVDVKGIALKAIMYCNVNVEGDKCQWNVYLFILRFTIMLQSIKHKCSSSDTKFRFIDCLVFWVLEFSIDQQLPHHTQEPIKVCHNTAMLDWCWILNPNSHREGYGEWGHFGGLNLNLNFQCAGLDLNLRFLC